MGTKSSEEKKRRNRICNKTQNKSKNSKRLETKK